MKASEFVLPNNDNLYNLIAETKIAWGRHGKQGRVIGKTKLKYRCTSGPRKSRIVSNPNQCFAHPNIAQAQRMKKTRARTKVAQARKTKRTKRLNIASKLANRLNKLLK